MVNCEILDKVIGFQMKGLNYRVDLKRLENNNSIDMLGEFFKERQNIIEVNSIKIIKETSNSKLDYHCNIIENMFKLNKNELIENCCNGFSKFFAKEIKSTSYYIKKCNLSVGNLIYFHYFMTLTLGEVYDPESLFLEYKQEYNFIKHEEIMALITELMENVTLFTSSFISKAYHKQLKENGVAFLTLPLKVTNQILENIIVFLINDCKEDTDYSSFNYIYNYSISNYNNYNLILNIEDY